MGTATPKQRVSLSLGAFIAAQALMGISHEGMMGTIIALGLGYAGWSFADEVFSKIQPDGESTTPSLPGPHRKHGIAARLLRTREQRMADWMPTDEAVERELTHIQGDGDFDIPQIRSETFVFSLLLASGWRPSLDEIFLARLDNGTNVFVSVKQIVHIALAGASRQGKTSIIRQILAQLCYIGCHCLLLDPHYTPYDIETNEDWTPFTEHLRTDPMKAKSYDRIEEILEYTATTFLEKRKELRAQMKSPGTHTFIFIDEYPAIIAEKPKVQGHIAKLLREGGKYHIHLVIASQDFQVKTISPQAGGAIREHYNVCLYVGGDSTTAKVLLNRAIDGSEESQLGKGLIYLRCPTCKEAAPAHTPWMDNQAITTLAGPSLLSDEDIDHIQDETDNEAATLNPDGQAEKTREDLPEAEKASVAPNIEVKLKSADLHIDTLVQAWNTGINTVDKIEAFFKMSHREAYKAYLRVKKQRGEPVDEQE